MRVAIVGDVTHSRVAKSNIQILTTWGKLYFAGRNNGIQVNLMSMENL